MSRVVAAISLIDIGALDRTAGEPFGRRDDGAERVAVIGIARQRTGVQHELTASGAGVGGDDRGFDAELVGRAGLALADALDLWSVERIELPAALALLLGADLVGLHQRPLEGGLEIGLAGDLAADVADDAAEPYAQQAQFSTMAVELFGVGIAPRHHGGALGYPQIRLPQPHAMLPGQPVKSPDRRMQQLGVGRESDGLGLHGGVDRDPLEVLRAQCVGLMRHPQALGQQKLKLGAEPLTPMAQVGALVREAVLEELLAGEVLKVGVVDPALAHLFIGQAEDVLEKHQSDHEARRNPGPALVAVERSDLLVEVLPIEPAGELDQLMLHVDDLIEPGPEQITFPSRLVLLRPHRPLRCSTESLFAPKGNPKNQIARFRALKPENLAISKPPAAQKMTLSQALSCCSRATTDRQAYNSSQLAGRPSGPSTRGVVPLLDAVLFGIRCFSKIIVH